MHLRDHGQNLVANLPSYRQTQRALKLFDSHDSASKSAESDPLYQAI